VAKVFLSYARLDGTQASRVYRQLSRKTGHEVWFDQVSLAKGIRWEPAIRKAIRDSRYFVGVFSRRSVAVRGYRHSELRQAMEVLQEYPDDLVYAIPVRLDDCQMPDERLEQLNRLDLFPSWRKGITDLCRALGTPAGRESAKRTAATTPRGTHRKAPAPNAYRVALLDLGAKIPGLSRLADGLNRSQSFFHFSTPRRPSLGRITTTIKGIVNFDVDKVPEEFYAKGKYLAVDLIASFTKEPVAFTENGKRVEEYFTATAGPGNRFLFLSVAELRDYTRQAGRTFAEGITLLLTGELIDFFTEHGYHDETRGCVMDYCDERSDIVEGLKARRLCKQCEKRLTTPGLKPAIKALLAWSS
jgi:TIR domain-containing protein